MRLIDADLMIKNLEKDYNSFMEQGHKKLANAILDVLIPTINCQPTVDTDKHGHWVWNDEANLFKGGWVCSLCKIKNDNIPADNMALPKIYAGTNYCGNCGAKMDEVSENGN